MRGIEIPVEDPDYWEKIDPISEEDLEEWIEKIPANRTKVCEAVKELYKEEIDDLGTIRFYELQVEDLVRRDGARIGVAGAKALLEQRNEEGRDVSDLHEKFENAGDSNHRNTAFDRYRALLVQGFTEALSDKDVEVTRKNGDGPYINSHAIGANAVRYGFNNWEELLE